MRHCKKKGRLSRRTPWRKATLKALANDLLTYQRIETTVAKAKVLRGFVEPLITLAKDNPDSLNARREAFRRLCDRGVVKSLFGSVAPLYKDMSGGYTRIMQFRTRKGDGAPMAIMELVKRTVTDEELLGTLREKAKPKEKLKLAKKKIEAKEEEEKKTVPPEEEKEKIKLHAAPTVKLEEKEEHTVEDIKKEKAKTEQRKLFGKGFFKRFRRKSLG